MGTTDREKTIKNFEHEVWKARGEGWDFVDVTTEDGINILKLLKEQEPVEPIIDQKVFHYARCGKCGQVLHWQGNYCHWCGRAVKWYEL